MSKALQIALGVAAVVGVGTAAVVLTRKGSTSTALPNPKPQSPALDPSLNPPGVAPGTSTSDEMARLQTEQAAKQAEQDRLAAIQKQLEAQAAAEAERLKQAEISRLRSAAAGIENDQIQVLTQIKAITEDNSRFEDFRQQYINAQISSGRFEGMIQSCRKAVWDNCPGPDWARSIGRCDDDNYPMCEKRQSELNDLAKGTWNGNTPRNPWKVLSDEAIDPKNPSGAYALLAQWKNEQRKPYEAQLARLEVQYQGVVRELKERFGFEFVSQRPEAHAYKA